MIKLLLIVLIVVFLYTVFVKKVHIDFNSFLHRGFKKKDNAFGLYCYTGKQGKR